MKEKLKKLTRNKYIVSAILIILLVFMVGLITIIKPSIKNIRISNILTNTNSLSASVIDGVTEEITSNNYDEIKYQIRVEKENASDEAVIVGTLTDEENKYARFKSIKEGVVTNNGKEITITSKRTNITITVIVENAPYGVTINPKFNINSLDENNSKINVTPVVITGKSVEGKVLDEKGVLYKGIELGIYQNGNLIKSTYTKDGGAYVLSLGEVDNYEIKLSEQKYKIVRYTEETTDENRRVVNIVIKEVEPFSLNIKKTISKLDLVVNGKKEVFNYDDETKVQKSIKNAKTIEGSIYYNIYIKNEGEVKGTLTAIKDVLPDGLSFDESKNPGWTKEDNNLFYTVLEGTEIESFENKTVKLVLDINKTDEAKSYINKAIASGDDYKYVVYYLNNRIYKEEYVINSEKINDVDPNIENFDGWYTDKKYTNKYNFNNTVTKDLILYGKIKNNKYNVTFIDKNPNNGFETILDIVEVNEGDPVDLIDHPEYNGYTFECFTRINNCYQDEEITEDVELYTSYTINEYEISYNLDGGTLEQGKTNPTIYTVNDEITLNNPSKEGFTFLGWTGPGLSEETINVTIPIGSTGRREYTAHYQINRSTLTINPNGGLYENSSSIATFTEDYGTIMVISDSERNGYNFKRYDKVGGGIFQGNVYTFNNDDATLTAAYEIIPYEITYDNITDEERTFLNNKTEYNVETETFTLKNPNTRVDTQGNNYQDFLGWDDGNGNTSLTVTIPKGSTGDKAFSAVWKENEDDYGITYELHGGTYEQGKTNPSTYNRQSSDITLNNPSKPGYRFTGWTGTGLDSATTTVIIPTGSAGPRSYEAHYEIITYNITYNGITEEELASTTNPKQYTIESDNITLHNPTRTGYVFKGWSGTDIEDKSLSVTIPTGSIGDREYTANFDKAEYSITYTLNDGVLEEGKVNPDKYSIESDPITLFNPSKVGYTFKGWSGTDLTGNENITVTIPTGSIGHRSYLANYTPIDYNITYDYAGGSLQAGVTNPDKYNIETPDITLNVPEKEGYIFTHYTLDNNVSTGIPTGSTGDKHFVAHYEIIKYTVNYYKKDVIYASEQVDWNTVANKPTNDPTYDHEIFLYWSEDRVNEYDFSTHITTNKNLYDVTELVVAPIITVNPTLNNTTNRTWVCNDSSNDNCGDTVTITSGKVDPEYTLYYQIGDGTVVEYTGPFPVYENTTITAFAKKSGIYSEPTEEDIVNVDGVAPTINNPGTGAMSFSITISGTAQDAGSGVKKFTLYAKEKDALVFDDALTYESAEFDGIKDHAENYDHTFYGVTGDNEYSIKDDTEYIIKIVAEDYVGNISEREVEVKTHPYVARVVGKNGMLWYHLDPDTHEIVMEDGKEFLLFDSIQSAVNYCADVQCTVQTNPIFPVVEESVTIDANQNITMDLDGRTVTSNANATFINNGTLQVVDRNPEKDEYDNYTKIGRIINTENKGIINNGTLILGEGSNEPSEVFITPELDKPVIEAHLAAIEQNDTFYFFDGKLVSDVVPVDNNGEDAITQYSYNAVITGEDDKQIGTLRVVTDPEARIRSTYYAKLKVDLGDNAFDSSKTGTVSTEERKILSKIKQNGEFGFIYDEVNDQIVNGNTSSANSTAKSYIKLDLTSAEKDMYVTFDVFADTYSAGSYGYVSVSETLNDVGTQIYRKTGNDARGSSLYCLEKGKVYYINFVFIKAGGEVNKNEKFIVSNFRLLGERIETSASSATLYDDPSYYSFDKQEDGTYIINNIGIAGNAHSYAIYDLTNVDYDITMVVNVTAVTTHWRSTGWIYLSNSIAFQAYNVTTNRVAYFENNVTNQNYSFTIPHGEITYVHFGYYNYNATGQMTINSITYINSSLPSVVSQSNVEHNSDDSYYFEHVDYNPYYWKDSSSNETHFTLFNTFYDDTNKGFIFNGRGYGYLTNSDFGLTDFEESVYLEYSTTNTNNSIIYMGSNKEKLAFGVYYGYIIVSNRDSVRVYTLPSNYADGNKHSFLLTYKDGTRNLYFDDEEVPTGTRNDYWGNSNANTYIGRNNTNNYFFNGKVYTIKVYNAELTPDNLDNTENLVLNLDGEDAVFPADSILVNNNTGVARSTAHSYIAYDLTNSDVDKYLYVNVASDCSTNLDYGYVQVTDSASIPTDSNGREIYVYGNVENRFAVLVLKKNQINYVHFAYVKTSTNVTGADRFAIKDIKLCDSLEDAYSISASGFNKINNYTFEKPILNEKVDTIELLKNITLNTTINVAPEKEVVLDLNGFTLTSNISDYIIKNNGNLTIKDSDYDERHSQNVEYRMAQAELYEEAKSKYLEDLAEYNEYAGLCDGCEVSAEYKINHYENYMSEIGISPVTENITYTGDETVYQVTPGLYKLEVWGAQGGSVYGNDGGFGSYSIGTVEFDENTNIYINVGGQGSGSNSEELEGGYNGGGDSHGGDCAGNTNRWGASGGGATSITTVSGELKDLDEQNDKDNILIVAGGGGGAFNLSGWQVGTGGHAGGFKGTNGNHTNRNNRGPEQAATGGTQTSAGRGGDGWEDLSVRSELWFSWTNGQFGLGGKSPIYACGEGGGGGGGFYGGGGGAQTSGGGGSGYIGNELLNNKKMVCYNCATSSEEDTKTISNTCVNANPNTDCSKTGNGYAKVTLIYTKEQKDTFIGNERTYTVKDAPVFKDYISNIDFGDSINIDTLTPTTNVDFGNKVSDSRTGAIVTTIENAVLNEEYGTLLLDTAAINVNVNSKTGIVNRGKLSFGRYGTVNANNASTIALRNETTGDIVSFNGVLNAVGSSSRGLLNESKDSNINGIRAVTSQTNAIGIVNSPVADVTYSNLDISGSGVGFNEYYSSANTIITNSNIKSTGNASYVVTSHNQPANTTIESSNLNGSIVLYSSPRIVNINNTTYSTLYNYYGIFNMNSSTGGYIENSSEGIIENSTISGASTVILNNRTSLGISGGNEYIGKLLIKNSIVNSTATSAVNVINNMYNMTIDNTTINNTKNASSTAINNSNSITSFLHIIGSTTIDSSFGTAINNVGRLTIGSNEKNIKSEYNYVYTGHQEEFTAPEDGLYKLETWGGAGSESGAAAGNAGSFRGIYRGGYGAYASGVIELYEGDKLYIHVGAGGKAGSETGGVRSFYGSYNGGGANTGGIGDRYMRGSGGGATDISLSNEDNIWYYENGVSSSRRSVESYNQRILVAGGGSVLGNAGGIELDDSKKNALGYGARNGGGGYYGGASTYGGTSYASNILTNVIFKAGNEEMPSYNASGSMFGNIGNGHAKITLLNSDEGTVTYTPTISATNYGITGAGRFYMYDGTINATKAVNASVDQVQDDYDIYISTNDSKETMTLVANANSRPVPNGEEEFVCKIGNAKYTTIQNAIDASNNGDEIDLLVDINQQNVIEIPSDKEITIDYNGHIVTSYADYYLYDNKGYLTITDSTNTLNANTFYGDKYIYNEGTLVLSKLYIKDYSYSTNIIENNEGNITLDSVKLDLTTNSTQGIINSENGIILAKNSTISISGNRDMFINNGSLTLKENTITCNNCSALVNNKLTGTATLDANNYSISGSDSYGRFILYNNQGTAIIKNTTTLIEDIYNSGVLTLQDNTIPSGAINTVETGLVIINSGTYSNTFSINGTGRVIDDTDNLYSFIMNNGSITTKLSLTTSGISNIKNGSIIVSSGNAIDNTGNGIINLGIKDGLVDTKENTRPIITGVTYGIYNTNPDLIVNFYDGIVTGETAYNVSIGETETGYSIKVENESNKEIKYLTSEPIFKNITQDISYNSISELNTAITNGLVSNNDTIQVFRNITITANESAITIPNNLSITFDLNDKRIDKNNNTLFIINGELNMINSNISNDDTLGVINSTHVDIFENNGTLNISSGIYISERDTTSSSIVKNNENASLTITGGEFTKYYDLLGYRQYNSGQIVDNSGTANVSGGKFYANGSYVVATNTKVVDDSSSFIRVSAVFNNNITGSLTVTGGDYDGIISANWSGQEGKYTATYTTNKGELIHNAGTATFTGITSNNSAIGRNTGTLTFTDITMENIVNVNNKQYPCFINSGTVTITDSEFSINSTFMNNNGGEVSISGTTIDRLTNGTTYRDSADHGNYGYKNSHVIRNTAGSTGITIINSNIYNRGSGEVFENRAPLTIEGSTIQATNNTAINSYSAPLDVTGNSKIESLSGVAIYLSSSELTLGKPLYIDNVVSKVNPVIVGKTYAINNSGTINFYDGILKGKTNPVNGIINNIESGYGTIADTEDDYHTTYLDRIEIIKNVTQSTQSNEVKYYDLKTAFSEANSGDILQMIANYNNLTIDETAVINTPVTFDMNGKVIRQSNSILFEVNDTLTIIDSSENYSGKIITVGGTNTFENNGTINFLSGNIQTGDDKVVFLNNANSTLVIRDKAVIDVGRSTIVDNSGTLNIYNGAHLHNTNYAMIINKNILNVVDLNRDDDENTSSEYLAPWLYDENNTSDINGWALDFTKAVIKTIAGSTTTIYGGIFNNNETYETGSPARCNILYNQGTTTIKNLENYSFTLGFSSGNLTILNSHFYNGRGAFFRSTGTLVVKDTIFEATADDGTSGAYKYAFGTSDLDNVTFISRNGASNSGESINIIGPTTIRNSSINLNTNGSAILVNSSTLDVINTTINGNYNITNNGTMNLDSTTVTNSSTAITNTGTLNLTNNTTVTSSNSNAINNTGTLNVFDTVSVISQNGVGIRLTNNGVLTLGEMGGGVPSTTSPYIEGTTFGVYRENLANYKSYFNFYDGLIVGQTGTDAVYGGLTYVESGYETITTSRVNDQDITIYEEVLRVSSNTVAVAKVGTWEFATNGAVTPTNALQAAVNFAIVDGRDVDLVAHVDLVNDQDSVIAAAPVTINTNGFTITTNSTYYLSSNITVNSNGLGGNISKALADIFDLSFNPKDIVIYEMSDGSSLDTLKSYTLYKDGEKVGLEKEELGRYRYKGNNEELTPIKGRLYIDNLSKGSYRLESSDNKYIEFSIDSDGNLSGNVTENTKNSNSSKATAKSEAELILSHQTGNTRYYYYLAIIPVLLLIILLFIMTRKYKERNN